MSFDSKDTKSAPAKVDVKSLDFSPVKEEQLKYPDSSVTLISSNGKRYVLTRRDAAISGLVRNALSDSKDAKDPNVDFPVTINGDTLGLIVAFMTEHKGVEPPIIPKPLRSRVMKDVTNEADAKFIDNAFNSGLAKMYNLTKAANYMDIKSLLSLCAARIAAAIKGKSLEEVKGILDPDSVSAKVMPVAAASTSMSFDQKDTKHNK